VNSKPDFNVTLLFNVKKGHASYSLTLNIS